MNSQKKNQCRSVPKNWRSSRAKQPLSARAPMRERLRTISSGSVVKGARWKDFCVAIALVTTLFAQPRSAGAESVHLVSVAYGTSTWDSSRVEERLRSQLEQRLIPLRGSIETRRMLDERLVHRVDESVGSYIRGSLDALSVGREAFFAEDYEGAVELILPRLDAVESAPEVLAFHVDFVPVLVDSFLILAQAYELLDRATEGRRTMERVASLFMYADMEQTQISPLVAEEFRTVRDNLAHRIVRIRWTSEASCEPYVNGSKVSVASGGELLAPEGRSVYLQFRCEGFQGVVRRIMASESSVTWSFAFDDALHRTSESFELQPRSSSDPEVLPAILQAASSLLEGSVVSIAKVPVGIGVPDAVELGFVTQRGRFRAVRLSDEAVASHERLSEAVDYLLGTSSTPPEPSILWKNDPAWVAVGDWTSPMIDEASRTGGKSVGGAAFGWAMLTTGVAAGGAAAYFLIDQRKTENDIANCSVATCLGGDDIVSMRETVERDQRLGIILGATSVAAIVTGSITLAIRGGRLRQRRHLDVESASLNLRAGGASIHVGMRF